MLYCKTLSSIFVLVIQMRAVLRSLNVRSGVSVNTESGTGEREEF